MRFIRQPQQQYKLGEAQKAKPTEQKTLMDSVEFQGSISSVSKTDRNTELSIGLISAVQANTPLDQLSSRCLNGVNMSLHTSMPSIHAEVDGIQNVMGNNVTYPEPHPQEEAPPPQIGPSDFMIFVHFSGEA